MIRVITSPSDTNAERLAKARVALRRAGVHPRIIDEFTTRALSGGRFEQVLAETIEEEIR